MQIQFTARHFDATPELRTYAEERIQKLSRVYDGISEATIVLTREDNGAPHKGAEMSLRVYRQTLTARDTAPTHEQAIDTAVSRLRRQLMRYKAQLKSTNRFEHR